MMGERKQQLHQALSGIAEARVCWNDWMGLHQNGDYFQLSQSYNLGDRKILVKFINDTLYVFMIDPKQFPLCNVNDASAVETFTGDFTIEDISNFIIGA